MDYTKDLFKNLKYDLPAGLVVFLVALPLCLGVALASGAPLFSGVIAGFIGGILVGALSGSPLGVSGPAAGLTVIVLSAIQSIGTYEGFLLAVVLAGVFQILLGIAKAGIIGYYFPSSVIKGMLAAIGLILILKQIPHALGFDKALMSEEAFMQRDGHNTFSEIIYAIQYYSPGAIVISLFSITVLMLFDLPFIKRIALFKFIPGALVVVVSGVAINHLFELFMPHWQLKDEHLVFLPVADNATHFFSFFTTPDFTAFSNPQVYVVAATLAIVASLETLLCVEATDKLDPEKRITPTNRELFAQGAGNIVSGLIGGIPLTQVIVRSSANINSGGKSKLSTIIHGILMLGCAIFIPTLLNQIPLACLAAILLVVGYKLSKVSLYKEMYRIGWQQFIPFTVTILAILFTDLLKGIGIGMAISIFYILRSNFRTPFSFNKEKMKTNDVTYIHLSEEVSFLNKGSILLMLDKIDANTSLVIDGSRSAYIDYDVLEIIQTFKEHTAPQKNIKLELINIPEVKISSGH